MQVVKRNGERQGVDFGKITARIAGINAEIGGECDPTFIALETIRSMCDGISTSKLDDIAAQHAYAKAIENPAYGALAARIVVSNLHKSTPASFSRCIAEIARRAPRRLAPKYVEYVAANAAALDAMIVDSRDYLYGYTGMRVLLRQYLIEIDDAPCDRPQYMHMRVAIHLWMGSGVGTDTDPLQHIRACYESISRHLFTHASPTMFNACTSTSQLNSCFLFGTEDNIGTIMDRVKIASFISKSGGGVGMHMSNIRAAGSQIATTGGAASGVPNQLHIFGACARIWNQGGKRPGAMAVYLAIWHADIMQFIRLKHPDGDLNERVHDLFYGIWCCDLFMKRLNTPDAKWSLFSEDTAPGLSAVYDGMDVCDVCGYCPNPEYATVITNPAAYGFPARADIRCDVCQYTMLPVFTRLYEDYERRGLARSTINPATIMRELAVTASLTGVPYMCHGDHVNRMSGQSNLGTIRGSNLCTEIMEVTNAGSVACCALSSVNLPAYVHVGKGDIPVINYALLEETVAQIVRNLDRSIDTNQYPIAECHPNAYGYRPIGIGIQGLANLFLSLRVPFLSPEAERYDMMVMETIYYSAIAESVALARLRGPYKGWEESPAARRLLHHDLWRRNAAYMNVLISEHEAAGSDGSPEARDYYASARAAYTPFDSGRYDWDALRNDAAKYGLRHSLHVALMPTASTAQIFGNNESFEPLQALVYTKELTSGMNAVYNPSLIRDLRALGLWNDATRVHVTNTGTIGDLDNVPAYIRELYKTVWEMSQFALMQRAARRGQFIDQAQSMNIHIRKSVLDAYESVYRNGWIVGLKTGSYYIRSRAATDAMKTNLHTVVAAAPAVAAPAPTAAPSTDVCRPGCDSCSA